MKLPAIKNGTHLALPRVLIAAALFGASLSGIRGQTSGGTNVTPLKDIYELKQIEVSQGANYLPFNLGTSIPHKRTVDGAPESPPQESDIKWSADKGAPTFAPEYGASVKLDFDKPFVKEDSADAKKVTVTAQYTGSATVEYNPQKTDVDRIYLDFWIAGTGVSTDDVLIVRSATAQPAADEKKVIHWSKVIVKHDAPGKLPLELESSGTKKLYFYGEEQNPNELEEDPELKSELSKEFETEKWFWIGTDEKGTGEAKFKAKGDLGTGLKDAPEEKTVNLLPVEIVQGELGTDSEDVGNWMMTEADPKPEVEMEITDAVVSGTDVIVTVQGKVTDRLSKFGEAAGEKVQTLKFIVDGNELHSINVANGVETGFDFDETITIPNAKPRGYTLRAETTENAAGNTGWDQVAVGLNLSPSSTSFPSSGSEFRIAFTQNPTDGQIDTAQVFFGNRGVQASDLTLTETAADSYQFGGQIKVTVDGQEQSVPCQLAIRGPQSLATGAIDDLTAKVSYTVPGLGENRLYGVWKETAANSLAFASSGYQGGDATLLVEAMINLPGSQQEDFEPITMRISGPDDWEDSDTVKIKVGDTKYPLKKFTFDGKESLYPYDDAHPDEPKQFLPSAKTVPQKLETPGYTAGGGTFDFKLTIDETEHDIQTVQVQRGFRNDFFAASPPVMTAQGAPAPQAMQAAAAEQGWREPGDKVTMNDLLTAYEWIYGTNEDAMTLLRAFQENGNIITLGDELGDLDVNYILRTDNKIEIEIEDDDNDVNPIVCANLLHAGLYQALAYPPLNTHQEILDNINLFIASRTAFAQVAAEITATAAEMYLSGITIIAEPLDWILVVNDVAEGQYASLAAALPFVPVGAIRTGGKIVFRTPGGGALGEIADANQLDAIRVASRKRAYGDKIAILEDAGLSDDIIDFLVRGGEIQYSKARAVLRNRMLNAGLDRPTSFHQAHHDFPWEFREWFAAHKIDVNDAQYGRWVHIDDHKVWHNENPKFNDVWEDFIYDVNGNQVRRSKAEIVAKLNEIRDSYQNTQ